jgi:hypothetical protein
LSGAESAPIIGVWQRIERHIVVTVNNWSS